jgi:CheY-like chemotaxis protein
MVQTAVDAYLSLAYDQASGGQSRAQLDLAPDAKPEEVLARFQHDVVADGERGRCDRYWLRLGNRNYPFMKLLLQEHIVAGEFYFAVDTHDQLEIRSDFPDYEAWKQLQAFNRDLRRKIEERLMELGLPTSASIEELCRRRKVEVDVQHSAFSILVVDDEEHLASAVASVLRARGFQVEVALDGMSGLDRARVNLPDLIVLDYEMPELDGIEVIARLRADDATRGIPVLFCTASKVSLTEMRKAEGFLAKPYTEALLLDMVDRLLGLPKREGAR